MTDWNDFEAKAQRARPQQELKPKRCFVGVLSHQKSPQDALEETDFVWMVGHSKITIQKIHDTYQKRNEGVVFQLKFKDTLVEPTDTVNSFLEPQSDMLLFVACPLARPSSPDVASGQQQQIPSRSTSMLTAPTHSSSSIRDAPSSGEIPTSLSSPSLHKVTSVGEPSTSNIPATTLSGMSSDKASNVGGMPAWTHPSISFHGVPSASNTPATTPLSSSFNKASNFGGIPAPTHQSSLFRDAPNVSDVPAPSNGQSSNTVTEAQLANPDGFAVKNEPIADAYHVEEAVQAPFDPESYFDGELSQEQYAVEKFEPPDRSIRAIIAQNDLQVLEAGVAQSMLLLERFKQSLSQHSTQQDAKAWIEAINKLIPQAERKRTIVGVVGNTGAGKSSVINAMLDEERLVPTNCMRACTAVVTEMSWNANTDPSHKYRAVIEFITPEDWKKELTTLMKDILTESGGISRDIADENSDAGIAWAKFHSVYPKKTRDSLQDCTVEGLMSENSVLAVLGTTKNINSAYSNSFYQQLQKYVDSKEKVTKKGKDKDKDKVKKSFEMEYWPLIKVVKIYVKAPALSTGAVIVDLPGVHDSNAARAAVAQGYMKQCTGLWIVAPINRAVDDKAAKTLLGESFKRQLKYDGGFSSVTFICSKTDDISITETIDTLELEEEVEELYDQQRKHEQEIKTIREEISELKEAQDVYRIAGGETSTDIETWEELQDGLQDGRTVYAPKPKRSKRKKTRTSQHDTHKRRQRYREGSDDDFAASAEDSAESDSQDTSDDEDIQAPQEPLTEDEIKAKIKELREAKKVARREGMKLTEEIKHLKPKIRELEVKMAAIKANISRICIAGRNEYSKGAIQQDFAAGLKELDQENAAEEDEDNFNPDEDQRDYDKVANSLPVFCVSSRAYQQMCGRLQKDDTVPGFETPEETEIPQLQAHCRKLTEAGRVQTARTFLLSLCQQLTTFSIWASEDGTGLKMTDDDRLQQKVYLDKRLSQLEKGLEDLVRTCLRVMKTAMNEQIFDKYPDLINEAISAAPDTAQKWGAHKSEGGLFWATYKAVVRRDGQYQSSAAGYRDFNADLVSPIVLKLATGWERAFQHRLPKAFDTLVKDSGKLLHSFHQAVEERARSKGVGLANLAALKTQIVTYEQLFADLNQVLIGRMTELQREANRDFTPTILNIMHAVYERCADEHGVGSFKRMKEHMLNYVTQCRFQMFDDATLTVKRHLENMCKALEEVMEQKADEIFIKMEVDYKRVLGGGHVQFDQGAVLPKAERVLRAEVMEILQSVDAQFEPIVHGGDLRQGDSTSDDGSMMDGVDDTLLTEPSPSGADVVMEDAGQKEDRGLPTPSDDEDDDAYEEII